jgi:LacI family transcriptional regulator
VLHNKKNIKDETRRKVQDAIRRLQYNPLRNIPLLRQTKTKTIGLILPIGMFDMSPFYHRAIMAAQRTLSEKGHACTIYSETDIERAVDAAFQPDTPSLRCDGVVCFCPNSKYDRYLDVLRTWRIPAVLVQRTTTVPGITTIHSDDYAGTKRLMEHLAGLGHTRIGLVHVQREVFIATERKQAFLDFVKERGWSAEQCPVLPLPAGEPDAMRNLALRLRDDPAAPSAVFCYDDQLAAWCLSELARAGLRVPGEMSVAGYDDDMPSARLAPPLTTMRMPVEEIVAAACRLLVEGRTERGTQPSDIRFPCTLVERESVQKPRTENG